MAQKRQTRATGSRPKESGRIIRWLTATETPRWWLILLTIVAATITLGTNIYMDSHKRSADNRAQQAQLLIDSMMQFYVHASALSNEVVDSGKPPEDLKKTLSKNLSEQFARLKIMEPLLPPEQRSTLDEYRSSILKMEDTVRNLKDKENMGAFWIDASKMLVARNRLADALRPLALGA